MKVIETLKEKQSIIFDPSSSRDEAVAAYEYAVAYTQGVADAYEGNAELINHLSIIINELFEHLENTEYEDEVYDEPDYRFDEIGYNPYTGGFDEDL